MIIETFAHGASRPDLGIFLAPFHCLGENPTLAIERNLELIRWLDHPGYYERGLVNITRTSLAYHHPFLIAQRWVQLDHMTRGRATLGCGPGALTSDAYMLGIWPATQRPRTLKAMNAIIRLLQMDGQVTMKTEWFEMNDARLHIAPCSDPHFEVAVASTITCSGDRRRDAWRWRAVDRCRPAARTRGAGEPMEDRRGNYRQCRQNHIPQENGASW